MEEERFPLARPLRWRIVGVFVVAWALVVLLDTVVVAVASLSRWALLVPAGVAALVVVVASLALRSLWVVRLAPQGYAVRLVPGVGVAEARWTDVVEAAATVVRGMACLELRLRDGRVTTLPVGLLDVDREAFARDVRDRLGSAARG